ncbi:MAG: AMIN domain-containing protein [Thermodesulfobacteriota bacterium]|nr:AMIN domain-containing protein [Thermodesulfobacteriota bacterium]
MTFLPREILRSISRLVLLNFILLTANAVAFGETAPQEENQIQSAQNLIDITIIKKKDSIQIAIVADGAVGKYNAFELAGPPRLVFDFFGVEPLWSHKEVSVKHPLLDRVRIGSYPEKVRVVMDITGDKIPLYKIAKHQDTLVILLCSASKEQAERVDKKVKIPPGRPAHLETVTRPIKKGPLPALPPPEKEPPPLESGMALFFKSFDFGGHFSSKVATDLNEDNSVEDLYDFRNHLNINLESRINDTITLFASYQIKYLLFKNTDTDDNFDPDFWEGYVDFSFPNLDLRIGKQIVRWGKTDELSPVDNINPQEFEEFFLPSLDERKIPIFLTKINYYLGDFDLEGIFIPCFKESHISFFNSDWAGLDHMKEAVERSDLPWRFKNAFESVDVITDEPPKTLSNSNFGLRVSRTFDRFDLALSYLYSRNMVPTVESAVFTGEGLRGISSLDELAHIFSSQDLSAIDNTDITLRYRRMNVWGVEMETTWGEVGVRAEAAYFRNLTFADAGLSKVDKDLLYYVIGADYTFGENLYFNLQFSQQIVVNYEDLFYQEEITNAFNGTINKGFMQGFLVPELYFYWNTTDGDYYLNPHITYKHTDNLSLILGVYLLGGDRETLFGNFKDNDEVYLSIKYSF